MQGRPSAKAKAASSKVSGTTVMQTPDQRTAPKISYRKRSPKSVAPKAPVAEPTTQANRSMDTISSKGHRPHAPPTHGALRQHHNGGHPRHNPFDTAERRESAGRAASVRLLVHVNARRPAGSPRRSSSTCRAQDRSSKKSSRRSSGSERPRNTERPTGGDPPAVPARPTMPGGSRMHRNADRAASEAATSPRREKARRGDPPAGLLGACGACGACGAHVHVEKRPPRARRPALPQPSAAVLSAKAGLTAGFGMGPGDPRLCGRARGGRSPAASL